MTKRILVFTLAVVLVLSITSVVLAEEFEPCTGDAVTGKLVAFDETTHTVVIAYDPGDGSVAFCSVTFQEEADYGHPVTTLLGNYFEEYFGSYDPDSYSEALAATLVCVVEDGNGDFALAEEQDPCAGTLASLFGSYGDGSFMLFFGDGTTGTLVVSVPEVAETDTVCVVEDDVDTTVDTYVLSDADPCEGEGFFEVTVTTANPDGSFLITFGDETTGTLVFGELETISGLEEIVTGLMNFDAKMSADGIAWGVGDDIAAKHDDGFGFGVIVKLYALAMESGEDLEALFEMFDSGTGMGHLFKEFGKPGLLGVGHVRQDTKEAKCNPNANPNSAVYCEEEGESDPSLYVEPTNSNSNKDKTKPNNGKNNKGD